METPFAITLDAGTSRANHTGSWRIERPLYEDESGNYDAAWRKLVEDNPLPAIMGRICFHPCETACNRVQVDDAVGINAVERFLGDLAIEHGWTLPATVLDTGKRILLLGAGPAG